MKIILFVFAFAASLAAQEIKVEEMPTSDVLKYLGIDPRNVTSTKFSVSFPSQKYGALEFVETIGGKQPKIGRTRLGPANVFTIEVFLAPVDDKTRTRVLSYKLSTAGLSVTGAQVIDERHRMASGKYEYAVGPSLSPIFKSKVGDDTYSLSFISSDSPIAE